MRKNLTELRTKFAKAEATLQATLDRLPRREQLALKAMLARDVYHIAMLYDTFLRSPNLVQQSSGTSTPAAEEREESDKPRAVLGFQSSLFE